jgi:hypothetical protein
MHNNEDSPFLKENASWLTAAILCVRGYSPHTVACGIIYVNGAGHSKGECSISLNIRLIWIVLDPKPKKNYSTFDMHRFATS